MRNEDAKKPVEETKLEDINERIKDNPYCVSMLDAYDLKNDLEEHSLALRALGALLKSNDLHEFADDALQMLEPGSAVDSVASNLRCVDCLNSLTFI